MNCFRTICCECIFVPIQICLCENSKSTKDHSLQKGKSCGVFIVLAYFCVPLVIFHKRVVLINLDKMNWSEFSVEEFHAILAHEVGDPKKKLSKGWPDFSCIISNETPATSLIFPYFISDFTSHCSRQCFLIAENWAIKQMFCVIRNIYNIPFVNRFTGMLIISMERATTEKGS